MKSLKVFLATLLILSMTAMTAFAGGWHSDSSARWWYQNDDGSYLADGWYWVNGRCYSFDNQEYMRSSCVTPDGYTVDDTGAWVIDGVVQTRGTDYQVGILKVKVPNGYSIEPYEGGAWFYAPSQGGVTVCTVVEPNLVEADLTYGVDAVNELLTRKFMDNIGLNYTLTMRDYRNFPTGSWYHSEYVISDGEQSLPADVYLMSVGTTVCLVMTLGYNTEFSGDSFMTYFLGM